MMRYDGLMPDWYVDKGLGTLIAQMKKRFPGIVIGTIAGSAHHQANPDSDHEPEADGSVDAADFMLGPHFKEKDADEFVAALVAAKDKRVAYIIWKKRIISSTVKPWEWRPYYGSDPHTGHPHLSVNDKHENDKSPWKIDRKAATTMAVTAAEMDQIAAKVVTALCTKTPYGSGGGDASPVGRAVLDSDYPAAPGAQRTDMWANLQAMSERLNAQAADLAACKSLLLQLTQEAPDNPLTQVVQYANAHPA